MEDLTTITLEDLAAEAAGERWDHEFARLLDHALDLNRDAEKKRVITLKIEVRPNEKRNQARMDITVDSKLAPLSSVGQQIHFGRHAETGQPVAVHFDPSQHDMFRVDAEAKVLPIDREGAKDAS